MRAKAISSGLALLALAVLPGLALAQGANPWRPQASGGPQYAPAEPRMQALQPPVAGSYAPPNL